MHILSVRFRPGTAAKFVALALACACTSTDYPNSIALVVVNGTITADVVGYGAWTGNHTATATQANGALTIIGEDENFVQITLFLVGIDVHATNPDSVRQINFTPIDADTVGYVAFTFGSGPQYSTLPSGHATVTLTHLAADRVVGTFALTAYPISQTAAPPQYTAVNGTFDIKPTIGHP